MEEQRTSYRFGERIRLPANSKGYTQTATVGGCRVRLATRNFADGSLGKVFIFVPEASDATQTIVSNFANAISIGLQYGVPLRTFVDAFTSTRFLPSGKVEGHSHIRKATSIIDFVFRELEMSYAERPVTGCNEHQSQIPDAPVHLRIVPSEPE